MGNGKMFFQDLTVNLKALADHVGQLVVDQTAKVVAQGPVETVRQLVTDGEIALLGRQPDTVTDIKNVLQNTVQLVADTAINVFNALPTMTAPPVFPEQPGYIKAGPDKVIANSYTVSGASVGDLSWLIYTENKNTNAVVSAKWKRVSFIETTSGYDSSVYINEVDKQIAITVEGTVANSTFSPWVLSKDGLTDLEIGLGVIPNQVQEGYKAFRNILSDLQKQYGSQGYGISLAGHSLGGALVQMLSGMYFLDTGIALPTLSEEGPGMLRQLKMYAEEQLLAGNTIYLPTGGTMKLSGGTLLQRAEQAKAIVGTFAAWSFSNVINLLTEQDPVGQVRYSADPAKDEHVGIDLLTPALLTARECLQDVDYAQLWPLNKLGVTIGQLPNDPLNLFSGLSDMDITRIDRHLPAQSETLWSGAGLGLYQTTGDIGLGVQLERTNGTPIQTWAGIQTNIPEVEIFGTSTGQTIQVGQYVKDKQNALYIGGSGNDVVIGSNNGDMLIGSSGSSSIFGGNGDNYISGGTGNSLLYGGSGNDIIYAGSGNCYLNGGGGSNLLIGGTGHDTFYWGGTANNLMYNGQAGGIYDFIIAAGATGSSQIKWERNFTNIGSSKVELQGALGDGSYLLFNFADEIRMADMQWTQSGNDITLVDKGGKQTGAVTFSNAVTAFAQNNGKLDFKFTNGSLYTDDQVYHVVAGTGTLTAVEGSYAGNIMVSGAGNNTVIGGKGNDWIFGGAGKDVFVFNNDFGNDHIVSSNCTDTVKFTNIFNASEYSLQQSGDSLVIDYRQTGTTKTNELVLDNWFASGDRVNQFAFNDGMYMIKDKRFVKVV